MSSRFEITALQNSTVHMKEPKKVNKLIKELVTGGRDKLQVIADFDNTLSRFSKNGKRCVTCHKALDDNPRLPDTYREQAHGLRNKYYPMEIDPNISDEDKFPLMVKWWTQSHDLLVEYKLNRNKIEKIVKESELYLRDGCQDFFHTLNEADVPLLIFSAGLGNIIEAALSQQANVLENMKIVSNFMEFDSEGEILGFKGNLIHSLNKHQSAIHKSDYFDRLESRENIILLGDSLGDLRMAEGASHMKHCLKIGFLNDKINERLAAYLEAYDIVLISDETMDVPDAIIHKIVGK